MDTISIMQEEITLRKSTDSGAIGDALELALRSLISGRRCRLVKRQGAEDIRVTMPDGKRARWEIKSACGELPPRADYVAYCVEVDPNFPAELQTYVIPWNAWENILRSYPGRGKLLKWDEKRGKGHIQSFQSSGRPNASRPIRAYLEAALDEFPTVEEVLAARKGRKRK